MDGLLLEERRKEQDSGGWVDCLRELRLEITQLRGEVATLRRENLELRQQVGYWKGMHARALERIAVLEQENENLRGENRRLQQQLFGKKSEKQAAADRSNHIAGFNDKDLADSSAADIPKKKQRGPKRRDFSHLPARNVDAELPADQRSCPTCHKPFADMTDTEDSEQIEIEVQAYRRVIRRRRYRKTCTCPGCYTITAPAPAKLIPKSLLGTSVWVEILLAKYFNHQPTDRLLSVWQLLGLDLADSTVNAGLERLQPLFQPLYEALTERNRGPAVGRKNYYGSGAVWSGQLAMMLFSLFATLSLWTINPRHWLRWYLDACAVAGGQPPSDIRPFLPWNMSEEQRQTMARPIPPTASQLTANTS